MSFLVYLFVLLVAAGSVIFGLDWTQAPLNPPPYAASPAQSATLKPAATSPVPATTASVSAPTKAGTTAASGAPAVSRNEAAQAQASATESADQPETTAAAAHCNVSVCAASYQSFRASDCTYQPYGGPRRVCTRTSAKIAAAMHPRSARRDEPRLTDRRDYRDYQDRRSGWSFGLFGYDDGR
jgi:hypothetical protein